MLHNLHNLQKFEGRLEFSRIAIELTVYSKTDKFN